MLFGDRRAREKRKKWEAELAWFRFRYLEPGGPTRCLKLLSRPAACGRIALCYLPDEPVSQLYLGLPESYTRSLQRMAGDFGISVQTVPPDAISPPTRRLIAVSELPWDRSFVAHIVGETLYADLVEEANPQGSFLPSPSSNVQVMDWQLPRPIPGLAAALSWNGQELPAHLLAGAPDDKGWLLGRSYTGESLRAQGRVNIYGSHEGVADWLTRQITHLITISPGNLVVIDGAGDVVSQLKRKAIVTRLLGGQLSYLDLDNVSLVGGFNPLAAMPDETEEALVQRWQRWFQGMNVHPQGLQLLAQARQEGVEDIPALRKWLSKAERQGQVAAASSLGLALNRLMTSHSLREWLEWPTNRFDVLPAGALFFACKNSSWDRQQLLHGALLAALTMPEARLIIHGFPWRAVKAEALLRHHERTIITNGPLMPGSTTVLVQSLPQHTGKLVDRFLAGDAQLAENLALLQSGDGIILTEGSAVLTTWRNSGNEGV